MRTWIGDIDYEPEYDAERADGPEPLPPALLPDPDTDPSVCPKSTRVDGPHHSTRWDGDDARTVCVLCGQVRDALSGAVLREGTAEEADRG